MKTIMTGRDLIIHILNNNLEDNPIIDDGGRLLGFLTIEEFATKNNVGIATVMAWIDMDLVGYISFGASGPIYIPCNVKAPQIYLKPSLGGTDVKTRNTGNCNLIANGTDDGIRDK